MPKYLYTIQIEFNALDDIEARQATSTFQVTTDVDTQRKFFDKEKIVKKLQEIKDNKPPRKVLGL